MIVRKHDPRAAMLGGVGDDLPQQEVGAALIAVMARQMQASRAIIDMGDPQAFALGIAIGQAPGEKGLRGRKSVER